VHGGEALPLARQVESSQVMVTEGQGAISPLDIGTRALAHGRQPLGLVMELVLGLGAQRTPGATGLTQRGAQSLGALSKRLAIPDGPRLGHAIERERGAELGVPGAGGGLRHIELIDLWPHLTRDALKGGLHVRHDALGLRAALHAGLAEPCVLGKSTGRLEMPWESCGHALAVATYPALQIDHLIGLADGAQAL
jgi:hypothetical protein